MISEHVLDYLSAYTLSALEEEEQRRVEAHLEHCLDCSLALTDLQEVTTQLALLVEPVAPPVSLRKRILAGVGRQERPMLHLVGVVRRHPTLAAGVSMAALLLLVVTGSLSWALVQLTSAEEQNQRLTAALLQQRSMAYLVAYPGTTPFVLKSIQRGGAAGALLGSPDREWGLLVVLGMPPLEQGQVYQLWLRSHAQAFDGGTFTVDETGYGQLGVSLSESLRAFDGAWVMVEPLGGSPSPTGRLVLYGSLLGRAQ